MRLEAGTFAATLGIAGSGLAIVFPNQEWVGWALLVVAGIVFIFGIRIEGWHLRMPHRRGWRSAMHPYLIVAVLSGVVCIGATIAYLIDRSRGPIQWGADGRVFGLEIEGRLKKRGEPIEVYIYGFQFNGRNRSGNSIYQLDASITLERSQKTFPLYAVVDGQWLPMNQTKGILPDVQFTIGCQTRSDGPHCGELTNELIPERFLIDVGPFVLNVICDGKTYTYDFPISKIEQQIAEQRKKLETSLNQGSVPRLERAT